MTAAGTGRRLVTVPRVVMSLLLAVAAAGMYVAFTLHEETPSSQTRPGAVRVVSPAPGSLEVRQTTVFYELASAYDGTLRISGVEVPEDQLDVIEGLNRISFTPGAGKEIESLEPGSQVVTAIFWPRAVGRRAAVTYTWRFRVH